MRAGLRARMVLQRQDAWGRDRWKGAPVPAWAGGPPPARIVQVGRSNGLTGVMSCLPGLYRGLIAILQPCSRPEGVPTPHLWEMRSPSPSLALRARSRGTHAVTSREHALARGFRRRSHARLAVGGPPRSDRGKCEGNPNDAAYPLRPNG